MIRFHREGRSWLLVGTLLFVAAHLAIWLLMPSLRWLQILLAVAVSAVWILLLQFFRNPVRLIEQRDPDWIYAPADGKVVVIEEKEETEFLQEPCVQISIFMSPLNVHVNRNPVQGEVIYQRYHKGKYLMAWNPKSSTENERNTVAYRLKDGQRILMRQIAGFMARRIVNYLRPGQKVEQGEDMGFIKFGSRVDVFVPKDAAILVEIGQAVRANRDVLVKL